ncbi:Rieske (2Fe-2S) protein [Glutamicibacter sp. NPDC087344]|uniref:Rieske (2Fe-2S) protein n=1 Tax=Glutamicibacter sp. NPDC087344 TaxID=3363994 RepID=UPI003814C55B
MTDFARPARRTIVCASAVLGSAALLTACGNGESAVESPEAQAIPTPSGEGQVLMTLADLPVGSRASAPATYPDGSSTAVMVYRADEKTVLAYSNKCTHQGCALSPKSPDENFYCACHGSKFNPADGTVVDGPAKGALGRYAAEIKGSDIVVYVTAEA